MRLSSTFLRTEDSIGWRPRENSSDGLRVLEEAIGADAEKEEKRKETKKNSDDESAHAL